MFLDNLKKYFIIALTSLIFLGAFQATLAASESKIDSMLDGVGEKAKYKTLDDEKFNEGYSAQLVGRFIGIFLGILGIIFTVLFVYAGYLWFTAQGDAAALTKSKDIMMRAVIGLVIVVGAYVITYFVTMSITKSGDYLN